MATERLYYADSFLREFEAHVLSEREVGGKLHVTLDRTAFYPTGGGQPFDQGSLNESSVVDVMEEEASDEIIHVVDAPVKSDRVVGRIDWARRLDHMQQHSGQHILSAAFIQVCNAPTVSFHLGNETCTIDLQTQRSIPDDLPKVIDLANQILFEDRPVRVLNVTREEAAALNLRKESTREGILRVIEVADFDRSPCGGTHVSHTGQVGVILPRKVERYKQGWRVEFVCGGRALRRAQGDFDVLTQVSKTLSSPVDQIPALIEKQVEESKSARRERLKLLDRVAEFEARELLREAKNVGAVRAIFKQFDGVETEYVRLLAQHATSTPRVVASFVVLTEKPQWLIATSVDVGVDAGKVFKAAAQQFPLRGGGSKNMAQGSLENAASIPALFEFLENNLKKKESD